jgi:ribose transport system substrate-binding protein
MADAFHITMHNGTQAAADAFGVDLLFRSAPKFDPEQQVSALNAGTFHQVERIVHGTGDFRVMIAKRAQGLLIFGCIILFIGI